MSEGNEPACGRCAHPYHGVGFDYVPGVDGDQKIGVDDLCDRCDCRGEARDGDDPENFCDDGLGLVYSLKEE